MSDVRQTLTEITAVDDPFTLFAEWFAEAHHHEPVDANAMQVATVGANGLPSVRTLLLKDLEADALVFYSNSQSYKGSQLAANPQAAICLFWKSLRRQIRADGPIEIVSDAQADAYFATRQRGSQIGAWASDQSRPLADRADLEQRIRTIEQRFAGQPVPRPPHWLGYRLRPLRLEFWQEGQYRLHDRLFYQRDAVSRPWQVSRLFP